MQKLDDWRKGRRSLRDRLYGVVLIPGIALLVLWSIVSGLTLYDGFHLRGIASGVRDVSLPAMRVLASAQKERTLSSLELTARGSTGERLARQRETTDRALAKMRATADPAAAPAGVRERMRALDGVIRELPAVRAQVDGGQTDRARVHAYYDGFLDTGSALFEAQARLFPDAAVSRSGMRASELFTAADRMARAASLASDGLRADLFTEPDHLAFAQFTGSYHLELESAARNLAPAQAGHYADILATPHFRHLVDLENRIVARGAWTPAGSGEDATPPEIDVADWLTTSDLVADDLSSLASAQAQRTAADGLAAGDRRLGQVAVGSVAALVVMLLATLVALRVSRSLSRRLNGLRDDALVLADGQLPEIVARLRRGERVDIAHEVARLDYGRDEIGQVAEAFNTAQRTAVGAAVRESQAREGVHTVFLGIAGRSQALVHRMLTMIDRLEREETDPDRMTLLFGLDHLATRARRNAENLIILGGGQPGRRWSRPIELADVLRSAVAETKHYARVHVQKPPELALHGDSVADTVHLLAELLDNATAFSPPDSRVGVRTHTSAHGVVAEVEDRGLGMSDEDRDAANAMLADPPEFDAMALRSDSRLGLFVVARLAARHGIAVELRTSAYGGVRAVVLLPSKLIVEPVEQEPGEVRTAQLPRVRAENAPLEPVEAGPAALEPPEGPVAPGDPAADDGTASGDEFAWPAEPGSTQLQAAETPAEAPEKPVEEAQPFSPATDSVENRFRTGSDISSSSDVTPSEDDYPATQSYRADGEEPSGSGAPGHAEPASGGDEDSGINKDAGINEDPGITEDTGLEAAWPTEDPTEGTATGDAAADDAPRVPPESPEETTDESFAWPLEEDASGTGEAITDPTGHAPVGRDEPSSTDRTDDTARPEEQDRPVPLPRRRKQANIAPELVRDHPTEDDRERSDAPDRSAEEVWTLMSAIQRGTDRGRRADPRGPDADAESHRNDPGSNDPGSNDPGSNDD
ncbi:nitrate- and nitrite sensing domain-containing protein [Saccharopolyspora sp. SCSIO 74807]|uniref:nitrate- and nitrite sensing domain-containing protein n=1 Tax=Saccharopolyspora sp. SCSIO 74807 TaxID=3118084 RepID=UPI0030D5C7FA